MNHGTKIQNYYHPYQILVWDSKKKRFVTEREFNDQDSKQIK